MNNLTWINYFFYFRVIYFKSGR